MKIKEQRESGVKACAVGYRLFGWVDWIMDYLLQVKNQCCVYSMCETVVALSALVCIT